ncbi:MULTISPECIES: hypothetical protein [unclassified Streptomyces]|uniref:hypothetical protein n=1 Tax=unclassified Streptomyces TaxID=2593676 RepID=UPI00067C7556|nr:MULTISPECIES: hypothetical protein [unclassified Streptomyces]
MTVTTLARRYVSSPEPAAAGRLRTLGGGTVHIYEDADGSLSSTCTGCGEYAWTLAVTYEFARDHAALCRRRPRRAAAA